jgi:hypothetical protein
MELLGALSVLLGDNSFSMDKLMKTSAIVSTLLFSVLALADSGSNQSANRVWITDVTIVSPESLDHIGKGSVLSEIKERRNLPEQRWSPGKDNI